MHCPLATTLVPRKAQSHTCLAPSRALAIPRFRLCIQNSAVVLTAQQLSRSAAHQDLLEKLNELLAGVKVKTRKATATAVKVVHVSKARLNHRKLDNRPRCTGLDLDIAWEATPHADAASAATAEPLQGLARVKLTTGGCDKVSVSDIQVMEQHEAPGVPCMPSTQPAPPEVLFAVESMDSAIMEQLNDFMWQMEQSTDFPLASFETDEDDADEQSSAPLSMEPEEITARLLGLMLPEVETAAVSEPAQKSSAQREIDHEPAPTSQQALSPASITTPTSATPQAKPTTPVLSDDQPGDAAQPLLPGLPQLLLSSGPEPLLA